MIQDYNDINTRAAAAALVLCSNVFVVALEVRGQSSTRTPLHSIFISSRVPRYTIRAKRGGSQSSYDSGGRKAQSAGAALRRYGEQALREDARALLKEWEGPLKVMPGLAVGRSSNAHSSLSFRSSRC